MLIICYTQTTTGQKSYDEFKDIDEFKTKHPDCTLQYIFNSEDECNIIEVSQAENFRNYCRIYGFEENDYKRVFKTHDGYDAQLIGFAPNNRKYKCRAFIKSKNQYYKMTPEYVKRQIEEYEHRNE